MRLTWFDASKLSHLSQAANIAKDIRNIQVNGNTSVNLRDFRFMSRMEEIRSIFGCAREKFYLKFNCQDTNIERLTNVLCVQINVLRVQINKQIIIHCLDDSQAPRPLTTLSMLMVCMIIVTFWDFVVCQFLALSYQILCISNSSQNMKHIIENLVLLNIKASYRG